VFLLNLRFFAFPYFDHDDDVSMHHALHVLDVPGSEGQAPPL